MSANTTTPKATVEVTAQDLQGPGVVFCPNPRMPLWSNHPRVYIDLSHAGEGACPYCGTLYKLKAGEALPSGH
ncbi:zinc-finger domain-containing protein [Roseateles sp.]|uniref:zinc-finger domain-containing protein n=1 Tax=Roseateles sp. TaxID=1971397 RepID=UPI0031D51909